MRICSIAYFLDPGWPLDGQRLARAGEFAKDAQTVFEQTGYEVQTLRLATVPFPRLLRGLGPAQVIQAARRSGPGRFQARGLQRVVHTTAGG